MVDIALARRGFLTLSGAAAVATLASCSGTTTTRSTITPTLTTTTASPTSAVTSPSVTSPSVSGASSSASRTTAVSSRPSALGPPDFAALAKGLSGAVVLPTSSGYAAASQLFNPRFDAIHPQAIVRCKTAHDVAECVAFARKFSLPLAVRSGGHCYAGWSVGPGLVIDTGPMSSVSTSAGHATVGAGTVLIDVYSKLAAAGVAIPGGSCPSVGITGLTLGGGIGVVDRAWGLTCDSLESATVVTADGKIRSCGTGRDADLLWACQGGGGGTFGVVTALTYRIRPTQSIATWKLSYPWSSVSSVISGWLRWLPSAPDELWGSVHLSSTPSVSVVGTFLGGDTGALDAALRGLVAAIGSGASAQRATPGDFLATMLIEAGCGGETVASCHRGPAGTVQRQAYAGSSDWIIKPLSASGIAALTHAVESWAYRNSDVAVQLDASGGAINRVRPGATAFVHRSAISSVQYIANWYPSTSGAAMRAAAEWPGATRTLMRAYTSGEAYQNYVDPSIRDWQRAYFGANYSRLQKVKARYDPENLFRHPQSVVA